MEPQNELKLAYMTQQEPSERFCPLKVLKL